MVHLRLILKKSLVNVKTCASSEGKINTLPGEKNSFFFFIWGKSHACSNNLLHLSVVPIWVEFASLPFDCKCCVPWIFIYGVTEVIVSKKLVVATYVL